MKVQTVFEMMKELCGACTQLLHTWSWHCLDGAPPFYNQPYKAVSCPCLDKLMPCGLMATSLVLSSTKIKSRLFLFANQKVKSVLCVLCYGVVLFPSCTDFVHSTQVGVHKRIIVSHASHNARDCQTTCDVII